MSRGPAYDAEPNGTAASSAASSSSSSPSSSSSSSGARRIGIQEYEDEFERGRARNRAEIEARVAQQQQERQQIYEEGRRVVGASVAMRRRVMAHSIASTNTVDRSRSRSAGPSLPITIPGADTDRRAAFRRAEMARRGGGHDGDSGNGSSGSDNGGYSPAELSAQATRLHRGIGVGPSWVDPAGRLRQLPLGTRLPSPVPLTEEELHRARTLGAQPLPPYPRRSPSPRSRPVFGPITYAEYMRRVIERAEEYRVFLGPRQI
ncbi:hypothetical protein CORC01_12435 [Colletotrichum orchidophilum]|uniref:Uncharacterized protein n=1 Tax=Colletotrichum orchidophilum TaxID=1209926 RepID=A0A1G4AT33_9PEZI|nr:uncharacterized protein CORC01_12435 [Colletotrichum orchidophilum]OHE92266.1 hypothetical protein CORC01_12435 [Colletotrichum orchidophilum]